MTEHVYYSHSDPEGRPLGDPEAQWVPWAVHALGVAALAFTLAAKYKSVYMQESARCGGLFHDLGKLREAWQANLLKGIRPAGQHSIVGAAICHLMNSPQVALGIAGHHGGISDLGGKDGLVSKCTPEFSQEAIALTEILKEEILALAPNLPLDYFKIPTPETKDFSDKARIALSHELDVRSIFSCFVDADRYNASRRYGGEKLIKNASHLLEKLKNLIDIKQKGSATPDVKALRTKVFNSCIEASAKTNKIFSLLAATGSGKTLASLAFALKLIELHGPNRIIFALPYCSLIEQNAVAIREISNVLEHHSAKLLDDDDDNHRISEETWNSEIIVTSHVRFFESILSNRSSELRRLHRIEGSIIVIDEAHMVPRPYIEPIETVLQQLAEERGTTILLSSSILPEFKKLNPCPIIRDDLPSTRGLVSIRWPMKNGKEVRTSWKSLISDIKRRKQCLVIVNTVSFARKIANATNALYLSRHICPAERSDIIAKAKELLRQGLPVRLVSTQIIEAGTDINFPVVFREFCPLDGLRNAVGRCAREGGAGEVIIFIPDFLPIEKRLPGPDYQQAAAITWALWVEMGPSLDNPEMMRRYYHKYYRYGNCDEKRINDCRSNMLFRETAKRFRLIEDETISVLVPYEEAAISLIRTAETSERIFRQERRVMQKYCAAIRPKEEVLAISTGLIYKTKSDILVARAVDFWQYLEEI